MPGERDRARFWFTDRTSPTDGLQYGISRVLASKRTRFQDLAIVDTPAWGKALILDGDWQSSVADEFLYHEPLVHPAMILHGSPRQVAILGGGEGAALREVLRWNAVERVVMVDLDGEVVAACREHLAEMHRGAFDDSRVELVIGDALDWLDQTSERVDVLISDLSEPLEQGPAYNLFTKEYYERVRRVLGEGGVFALQAGSVSPPDIRIHARLVKTVQAVFEHARPYASAIPSFGTPWGFVVASATLGDQPSAREVDRLLTQRTSGGFRMLDGEAFSGLFGVSAHIRRAIQAETTIYTLADPPRLTLQP